MDKEIVQMPIGAEAAIDLKLKDGNIVFEIKYQGVGAVASIEAGLTSDYFLDKLAALIPGKIDDAVIDIIKAALKA